MKERKKMEPEQVLIVKLDQFIRKFYTNRMIRGGLLMLGIIAGSYLLFVVLETMFHFNTAVRTIVFYLYLGIVGITMYLWIVRPLLSYLHLGKRISHEEAAIIIGQHFSEIEDKLLNALQLILLKDNSEAEVELLAASIDQKIQNLRVFQFNRSIDYKGNLRYLKVAVPPIGIILLALLIAPAFISEPTKRIVDYSTAYEIPFPYTVKIDNTELTAFQQEDFELRVTVSGEEIPAELYIKTDGYTYRMNGYSSTKFNFLFKSLQRETSFRISANRYLSQEYLIKVFPRPTILSFKVILTFPSYTGKKSEEMENVGDLAVLKGTTIEWQWETKDVEQLTLRFMDRAITLTESQKDLYIYQERCMCSGTYCVKPENAFRTGYDSLDYKITCLEDGYPFIVTEITTEKDIESGYFFSGTIKDDYGFSRLEFHYQVQYGSDRSKKEDNVVRLPVDQENTEALFYYSFDVNDYIKTPGGKMSYYFEIWDNDGINGPKATRSEIREIETLTVEKIAENTTERERLIRENMESARDETRRLEKTIDQMNRKLMEKQTLDWQEKRKIEEMIQKNEEMLETIEKVKEENKNNIRQEEQFLKTTQAVIEKQKRLSELMEELMTDEMKKTLEELKKLLDQVDKTKLKEMMDELKLTSHEMEQQLDRTLELFKQIEFERKLEETIEAIRKIAEEQEKLVEKTRQEEQPSEESKREQKELNKKFDSVHNELAELSKMEKELEQKIGIESTESQQDSIKNTLSEAAENLKNEEMQKAIKNQKNAADQLKQLASDLEMMQQNSEIEQLAEDLHLIRQILENLITISFTQEELIGRTRAINRNDPRFQEIISEQNQLNENLQPVTDSLVAIGKRQLLIQPIITRELNTIHRNIRETVDALTEKNIPAALTKQQYSMTSLNNLAVLLNEAMEQMNRNMNMSMQGGMSKQCQNPAMGKGKKNMKNLRQMQQQLSEQMEKIRKGLQEQKEGNRRKGEKGEQGKTGEGGLNEEIARLAAEQEAIREELKRYEQFLKEQGDLDQSNLLKAMEEMDENQRDLINKQITRESLLRQQQILTRLLESEKAEQVREQQEKREAEEAKNQKYSNPDLKLEYNNYSGRGTDMLKYKTLPVNLYYKNRSMKYLIQINQ
ncbi:MAG: hypothetical protein JXA23_05035 [Bacteroidales bacterium]|nr:hypothetical protein [Bacteroidales bacterium]